MGVTLNVSNDWLKGVGSQVADINTMSSQSYQDDVKKYAKEAGLEFNKILLNKMSACDGGASRDPISHYGFEAISHIKFCDEPVVDAAAGTVSITVGIVGDLTRTSFLQEALDKEGNKKYPNAPQLENVAALLNNGYDSVKHQIYGYWDTAVKRVRTPKSRAGGRFVNDAKDEFLLLFQDKYNVVDVVLSPEYEDI